MKIIQLAPDDSGNIDWPLLSADKKSVVTVGAFDGMHQGHRSVVKTTVELAKKENAFSVVIMFTPRPAFVHAYAAAHDGQDVPAGTADPDEISSVDQRLRTLAALGVDYVLVVRYTLEFADKSFRFFLGQLVGRLGMRTLVLGADASMGAGRAGTVEAIERLALATGMFELVVVDDKGNGKTRVPSTLVPQMPEGRGTAADPRAGLTRDQLRAWSKKHNAKEVRDWSSTNVRFLLGHGAVEAAGEILGAPHGIEGTVVHGEERGRTIGFPTANIEEPIAGYVPVDGVYSGWLVDLGPADLYAREVSYGAQGNDGVSAGAGAGAGAGSGSGAAASGKAAPGTAAGNAEEGTQAAADAAADADAAAEAAAEAAIQAGAIVNPLEARMPSDSGIAHQYQSGGVESLLAPHSPYRWPAAISIGTKPTFNEKTGRNERVVEAYALADDWIDLYGHRVRIEFEHFLRPQIKFDGAEELTDELKRNVADVRAQLS